MKTLSVGSTSRLSNVCFATVFGWILVSNQAFAQPRIDTISSTRSRIRDSVVLQGANFSPIPGKNVVNFGGWRAPVIAASSSSVTVQVPAAVAYAPVSVTVDGLSGWSSAFFSSALPTVGNLDSSALGPSLEFTVGGSQESVAAGDLDGDGRVDLVSPNFNGGVVCIFPGAGQPGVLNSGSFRPRLQLTVLGAPMSVAIGDVDGDGKLDVVVANRGGMISLFRNINAGGPLDANSFAPRVDFPTFDGDLRTLALGDLDGDGKLDIVVGSGGSRVTVLRNTGSIGTVDFAPPFGLSGAGQIVSLALGDLDGDHKLDLVACGFDGHMATIYRNIGSPGTLSQASFEARFDLPLGFSPFGIGLADIDGDNRLDLVAINYSGADLYVYQNQGSPTVPTASLFGPHVIFPAAGGCFTVAVGDVNGDGKVDIAVANSSQNTVSVFLNRSSGPVITTDSLAPRMDFPANAGARAVIFADLDGDGKLDVVAAGQGSGNLSVLHNNLSFPPDPPVINTQPVAQTTITGADVSLSVAASGGEPLSYQWRLNGINIPNANSPALMLPAAQASQSGNYSVVVSNPSGATASTDAFVLIDNPPVSRSLSVSVNEDNAVAILLDASDADNEPLTFSIGSPAHGRLTGTPPSLTYYPEPNYNGPDAFAFQVSDGKFSSEVATVSVTVVPVNDAPVAFPQAVTIAEDTNVTITLTGSDPDGDVLTFLVNQPQHGTLTGLAPNLVYKPQANYFGSDSFTFTTYDGTVASESATVSITITPVNDSPIAQFVVRPLYALPASPGRLAILALNNVNAAVTLDGSSSSDTDSGDLLYSWMEGSSIPFASETVVTRVFGVGSHTVTLVVNDGQDTGVANVTFEVLPPSAVVNTMRSLVDGANMSKKNSLYESLNAIAASLDKGNLNPALGQLGAFQNKLRAQMEPSDSKCASMLNEAIQSLVNELKKQ